MKNYVKDISVPPYTVYHEEYMGDKGKMIDANSPYAAALKYAQLYNAMTEHSLMDGEPREILVVEGYEKHWFKIYAEPSIDYAAEEIYDKEEQNDI